MELTRAPDTGKLGIVMEPGELLTAHELAVVKQLEQKRKKRMGELEATPPARPGKHAAGRTKSRAERRRLRRKA